MPRTRHRVSRVHVAQRRWVIWVSGSVMRGCTEASWESLWNSATRRTKVWVTGEVGVVVEEEEVVAFGVVRPDVAPLRNADVLGQADGAHSGGDVLQGAVPYPEAGDGDR